MATTEIVPSKIGEILAPGGEYEMGRIALRNEHAQVVEAAKRITTINNADEAEEVAKLGRLLHVAEKESETFFKRYKVQVDALKQPILDAEKADGGPYSQEKERLGTIQSAWDQQCLREKEEADRKSREEAEERAREEQLLRAIEVESIEGAEAALQILDEPIAAIQVATRSASSFRPSGTVNRGIKYSAEVTNLTELVKAIASGKVPATAVVANMSYLNNEAKQNKDAYSIPGTKLVKTLPPTGYRA